MFGFHHNSRNPIIGLDLTEQQLFDLNNLVLPAWLLLILLPRWKVTQGFATLTALAFSALYTLLFITIFLQQDSTFQFSDFFSLDGVKRALSTDAIVLPAWVHYVAFDLFTAKWMVQDSVAANIPHLLLAPVLVLTMLLGPCGLLAYFALRTLVGIVRRKDRTSGMNKTD